MRGGAGEPSPTDEDRAALIAHAEVRAAIALVAGRPSYRVVVSGMATTAAVLAGLDALAARSGVVLERRLRAGGGGIDVVVRAS